MKRIILSWLIGLAVVSGQIVQGAVDEGSAKKIPFSGYWWPKSKGEIISGPLTKYDTATGKRAAAWEYSHSPPGPNVPQWWGYCHAWSASAVMENEPTQQHSPQGPAGGQQVTLGVGDQKGMLAAAHAQDLANTIGDRYGDGQGSEDIQDMAPDLLWQTLRQYIKQQGVPIIMDLEAGQEVWNYPVYAYRVEYSPAGGAGDVAGTISIWAADDAVPPDHVGVKVLYHTYTFTCRMNGDNIVMGSGRWTGNGTRTHPDFAWYPYVVRAENPEVDYSLVKQLVLDTGETTPGGTTPGGTTPGGTTPGGTVPGGATPGGTPPPDIVQPGTVPPGGAVPGGLRPPTIQPGTQPPTIDPAGGQGLQGAPVSPMQLIGYIAQKTSAFNFDITVDRFDGGKYAVGEPFVVRGVSEKAGYLYLFYISGAGDLWLIYPQAGQSNLVQAGQPFEIGGANDPYSFQTTEPVGIARIKGVVTTWPLLLSGLQKQSQSTQQKGLHRTARREFRWTPSEQSQVKEMLIQYQTQQKIPPSKLDGYDAKRLTKSLGEFAQDEVAIYVRGRGK